MAGPPHLKRLHGFRNIMHPQQLNPGIYPGECQGQAAGQALFHWHFANQF